METEHLEAAIKGLPERARYVLTRRYGLDDEEPATLAKIGDELELSRERVRQLQREAERRLKSGARCAVKPTVPNLGRGGVPV
jgi:RNA polymerase primary sigma factor